MSQGALLLLPSRLWQIGILALCIVLAWTLNRWLIPRFHEWLRTLEGRPKWQLRVLVVLHRRLGLLIFTALIWIAATIVAEITNTPWMERHQYVLDRSLNRHTDRNWRRYQLTKAFHISPFMDMHIAYDWRFRVPAETINVHLNNFRNGGKLFDATLKLQRREINSANLSRVLISYPLMTAKVTAMIYWQALRLKLKGVPFYNHPGRDAAAAMGDSS